MSLANKLTNPTGSNLLKVLIEPGGTGGKIDIADNVFPELNLLFQIQSILGCIPKPGGIGYTARVRDGCWRGRRLQRRRHLAFISPMIQRHSGEF